MSLRWLRYWGDEMSVRVAAKVVGLGRCPWSRWLFLWSLGVYGWMSVFGKGEFLGRLSVSPEVDLWDRLNSVEFLCFSGEVWYLSG